MIQGKDKPKAGTSVTQAERRGGGRHPFIAAAEVVEVGSNAVFSTRTTDLGPGGCYIDTLVPFTAGSKVRITVREGQTEFEATGTVVYSQHGLGMGIAFDELEPSQRHALAVWLGEEVEDRVPRPKGSPAPAKGMVPHGSDRESLIRLVRLMVIKGLLTESEGISIFGNPLC
jgi:hypothetical protein